MTNLKSMVARTPWAFLLIVAFCAPAVQGAVVREGNAANKDALPIIELVRDDVGFRNPKYSIRIYEDGLVVYRGWDYVAVEGERTDRISIEAVSQLKQSFEKANFFEFRQVERNPTTGAIKYDCNEVRKLGPEYSYLIQQCQNKDVIEVRSRAQDLGSGDQLGYRQGDKARQLRTFDVYFPTRMLLNLARQIEDVVEAEKWTRTNASDKKQKQSINYL